MTGALLTRPVNWHIQHCMHTAAGRAAAQMTVLLPDSGMPAACDAVLFAMHGCTAQRKEHCRSLARKRMLCQDAPDYTLFHNLSRSPTQVCRTMRTPARPPEAWALPADHAAAPAPHAILQAPQPHRHRH